MRLRSHLLLLVAGAMVPLLALTIALAYLLVEHEKDMLRQAAMDRNRSFMSAVDAEIRGQLASLAALGASRSLLTGDLAAFYDEAERALRMQPAWRNIVAFEPSGRQVINVRVGRGNPLPPAAEPESVRRVFETAEPIIGDVAQGQLADRAWALGIRIPVMIDGKVAYVLTGIAELERFAELLRQQRYPDTWVTGLADSKGTLIARIPARPPGQKVGPDFWNATQQAKEGWFRGRTIEGRDTYTAHLASDLAGWAVGVAIPSDQVNAIANRVAWTTALGGLACLLLAIGFAWWMGRRISRPIASLAAGARSLGSSGEREPLGEAVVAEVRELARVLDEASQAIREREALRESEQHALKAADKAKDEFLAMLGHELRNPLSAISAAGHVLKVARPGEAAATQAHGVIERQSRQMTRLIEELLDVSRLAMGKVTLKLERLELADFAARVARTWQAGRQLAHERLELELSPVWVDADRARLEQVICNLLDNAEKFSPATTVIRLAVHGEGAQALVEVQDRGEGIPLELASRIFDLFVQGAQAPDRSRGGMGLGLTLVKRLVELHGGSVAVESEGRGTGACFSVRLPAAEPSAEPESAVFEGEARAESRRVLVVEDNDDGRNMLEAMLRIDGHVVRAAARGDAALALARNWVPEVAIVDIGLPDMDGYEVARRLRVERPGVKLVALTGYGQDQDQRRAYEAGFDLHLVKPVAPEMLRDALTVVTARDRALNS